MTPTYTYDLLIKVRFLKKTSNEVLPVIKQLEAESRPMD